MHGLMREGRRKPVLYSIRFIERLNRKVDINAPLRRLKTELQELTQ